MAFAIDAKLSSLVHAPTVDPGLPVSLGGWTRGVDLLPVVQLDAELVTSLEIVNEALVRRLPFSGIWVSGNQSLSIMLKRLH